MERKRFVTAVWVIALAHSAISTVVYAGPQVPPSAPTTVVNTTANPVPISGSITDRTGKQQAATLGGDVFEGLRQLPGELRRELRCA